MVASRDRRPPATKGVAVAESKQVECCTVESVVTVDERGQMVLPKDVRDKLDIKAGDKLAVVAVRGGGNACCITLIKAEALSGSVQIILKPMLGSGLTEARENPPTTRKRTFGEHRRRTTSDERSKGGRK